MASVNLRLERFLEENNLTAYKLAKTVQRGRENTVYRLARRANEVKRIDTDVLADIMRGLTELTGKPVTFNDLLEYIPDEN